MIAESRGDQPLVSVTIPVFNGQATVADAVRSVLAQSYPNVELIVVDDGSTDGTWDVLMGFGSSIRAIRQENSGIASARNRGLREARGALLALMDADDLCEPERIAAQVRFLADQPEVLLCCSDFSAFNAQGPVSPSYTATYYSSCSPAHGGVRSRYPRAGVLDISDCFETGSGPTIVAPTYVGRVYEEIALGNFVHPPTVLFRRSVLEHAGYFDTTIAIMCEWDWLVRAARVGDFGFIDRPLLRYRLSEHQVSFGERAVADSLRVARRICERDPALQRNHPEEFRRLFGALYADVADAKAERHPREARSLLATSVVRYHVVTPRTTRTLLKLLLPVPIIELVRGVVESLPLVI